MFQVLILIAQPGRRLTCSRRKNRNRHSSNFSLHTSKHFVCIRFSTWRDKIPPVAEMVSVVFKVACGLLVLTVATSAQLWDLLAWDDDDEPADDDGDLFFDYEDYNATSLMMHKMSSSVIRDEFEVLEESSQIVAGELNSLLQDAVGGDVTIDDVEFKRTQESDWAESDPIFVTDENDEVIEVKSDPLDEILTEHTIRLFNVISQLKGIDGSEKKLRIFDIFIWNNVSEDEINDVVDKYYLDR